MNAIAETELCKMHPFQPGLRVNIYSEIDFKLLRVLGLELGVDADRE